MKFHFLDKPQLIHVLFDISIATSVLRRVAKPTNRSTALVSNVKSAAGVADRSRFDVDEFTDADVEELPLVAAALTLDELDRVIPARVLLPPGQDASLRGARDYRFQQPGLGREVRVTLNPTYYEENAETAELWWQGNPTFPEVAGEHERSEGETTTSIAAILRGVRE
jgi:hypothetical protein